MITKNIHLEVRFHEGGFFSNFNKVTTFLRDTPHNIVKISWNLQGQPWGAFAYNCGEVFSKLFKEYNTGEDIDETFILETYTSTVFTGKDVCLKYNDDSWKQSFNKTLSFFQPQPLLKDYLDKVDSLFEDREVIGILKRNCLLKWEQPSGKMPTLDSYYVQIDNVINENTSLYLSVDNISDLNLFIKKYKKCIYNPKCRRSNTDLDTEPHFTPGNTMDAIYTYIEVYTLSKCKYFIHPVSNMATAVLYHNPIIKSTFL